MKVDSPNRYLTLNSSKQILCMGKGLSKSHPAGALQGALLARRQHSSIGQQECPADRLEFSKIFSKLINMGSKARHEKEKAMANYSRQTSAEEEVWQMKVNDLIWLELQGWQTNKDMYDVDQYILHHRQQVPKILNEVIVFRFKPSDDGVTRAAGTVEVNDAIYNSDDDDDSDEETDDELLHSSSAPIEVKRFTERYAEIQTENLQQSTTFRTASATTTELSATCTLNAETIHIQRQALIKTNELLLKLESIEKLYPTSRAIGKDHPTYLSTQFRHRVDMLCTWLNITKDLIHKLRLMANVAGVKNLRNHDWPWLDMDGPNQYDIDYTGTDCTPCNSAHFTIGDSLSSPVLSSHNLQSPEFVDENLSSKLNKSVRFSASVENFQQIISGPPTPDIDTYPSLIPADCSTPVKGAAANRDVGPTFPTSISRNSSELSLDESSCKSAAGSKTAIYRNFVDKTLKKMGMRKLLLRIHELLDSSLQRAKEVLEKHPFPDSLSTAGIRPIIDDCVMSSSPLLATSPSLINPLAAQLPAVSSFSHLKHPADTAGPMTASQEFVRMGLPSFRPCYLYLVRIPLDIIHECLRLRLEQCPENEPSILSIRQLISECKEALNGAMLVKSYYKQMASAVVWDDPIAEERLLDTDLDSFDGDMRHILDVYFSYIQRWMSMVQNLPEASRRLKNALEDEWAFTKKICPYVRGGEAEAGKRFCFMATDLLQSIADFLEQGIDEYTMHLFDRTTSDVNEEGDGSSHIHSSSSRFLELRKAIIHTCREFKVLFNEARERASKALGFAKMLKNDLEIAADFNISVAHKDLLLKLKDTEHVKVVVPHNSAYQMFVPFSIANNGQLLQQLLSATCGHETIPSPNDPLVPDEGYLLLVRFENVTSHRVESIWTGQSVFVGTTAEITIALSHIEVESLLLVVIHSSQLHLQRKEFEKVMGPAVMLVNEQTSCHQAISESMVELKSAALDLREKIAAAIIQIDEKLNLDEEMEDIERASIHKLYTETLNQCYRFGFEYHKEITRLVTGDSRQKLAQGQISFAMQWMCFAMEKCEQGRGIRPRWAHHGLDFLTIACEPRVLVHLTETQFDNFRTTIQKCICHIVGTAEKKPTANTLTTGGYRVSSPDVSQKLVLRTQSMVDNNNQKMNRSLSTRSTNSEPTPPHRHSVDFGVPSIRLVVAADNDNGFTRRKHSISEYPMEVSIGEGEDGGIVMDVHEIDGNSYIEEVDPCAVNEKSPKCKIQKAIQRLEEKRQNNLLDQKMIGKVMSVRQELDVRINVKRANFKWQRGIKIGEGQFGKVYTAVNIGTGELMAMKEISFQPNDHKTMKDIADEIRNFEGIHHPSLVRYYGVEVHKDDIMIFMEFCDGGTIEEAAKAGLAELLIRKYTKEILVAINVLHERGIVHRDIKGNNIFLLTSGQLKLGDFGCSAKLRNHTTIPGEFNSMVGTTAYMAPELYTSTKTTGHGRAADIWSLGCVVIEMATGKRPWHELDNDYQIMFKVGMGSTPPVPENLSAEGKDFITQCLLHDPKLRKTASELQNHSFVKIAEDDFD
ncbi:mitogen-activated protein kinase kinase kinase 4-like isoform X2 [Tubulanus polymorphus]|uniref:mitogen-activated protein kinase kinase kinase 4-like isoform X2 n=1 Tax=Tubulanus polymorphus TaxID=672921 RepID=UPI003DA47698